MARPAQQPPGTGRGPALSAVVDDDGAGGGDAGATHRVREDVHVRQRVAAVFACGAREFPVEVDIGGARDVARLVVGAPGRTAELPADVEQDGRLALCEVIGEG
jgi:hypothetical protein